MTVATLVASIAASAAAQGIYRWEDKGGHVTYSDSPPPADAKSKQEKRLLDNVVEQERVPAATKAAQKSHPVTLYITDCGAACADARALLTKRGIPFTELNPQTSIAANKKLKELVGGLKVPTATVGATKLEGFLAETWMAALDTAGYPKINATTKAAVAAGSPTKVAEKTITALPTPPSKSATEKK